MIRYIIEKVINDDYCHGYVTLLEDNKPKKFTSVEAARQYLVDLKVSVNDIAELYNIKPYVI